MKIASRFDEDIKKEKCPVCLTISQNFIDFETEIPRYGCLRCGCVFVPKTFRTGIDVKEMLIKQRTAEKFTCECGKQCANAAGLANHQKGSKCPLNKTEPVEE